MITKKEYDDLSKEFLLDQSWYVNHDYYDGLYYTKETYEGKEIISALNGKPYCIERISLEYNDLSKIYCAVPFYIDGVIYGVVLTSINFYSITSGKLEWAFLLGNFCFISLLISMPFILFLVLRFTLPVKRLSKKTLGYVNSKEGFDFSELPYENRNDEVGDLSSSFSKLLKQLKHSIDFLESFSSDITHELKNPISVICMNAEIMEMGELTIAEYKENSQIILSEAKRLSKLLSNMRENAKFENSLNSGFVNEKVDMDKLLENLIVSINGLYPEKSIVYISDGYPHILNASCVNLERLFLNLLENAVSFGDIVEVSVQRKRNKKSEELIVFVEDSGPGVPVEVREKIFKRFYSSRKKMSNTVHSGLGLSTVKAIVESMDGKVSVVNSKRLSGACFVVCFPI